MIRGIINDWARLLAVSLLIVAAVISLSNVALPIIFVVLAILTWFYWDSRPIPLSLALTALVSLVTPPINVALTAISTIVLDQALRLGNERPWQFYALPLTASVLLAALLRQFYIAVSLAIPLFYVLAISLVSMVRFYTVTIELRPSRELRMNAGSELTYRLTVMTKPRVRAVIEIKTPRGIKVSHNRLYIDGEASVEATARYVLGGVKRPRLTITFSDLRGLVRVSRVVRHPGITVMPRARVAIQIARGLLAQVTLGAEDPHGVREYMPGDPIRRIYWKKSAKLNRLIIKLLHGRGLVGPIILLSYASSPVQVDRVSEFLVYLTVELLTRLPRVEVITLDRDGRVTNYVINRDNYFNVIEHILNSIENLNVKLIGGGDYADILNIVKYSASLRITNVIKSDSVIIGQGLFIEPICKAFSEHVVCMPV